MKKSKTATSPITKRKKESIPPKNNNSWTELSEKIKNSILFLSATSARYNAYAPFSSPSFYQTIGSAFIIDIEKGLAVTTADIVENAVAITGRVCMFGKREISLSVKGICREKNLALCVIDQEGIKLLTRSFDGDSFKELNLDFADSLFVGLGEKVLSIGYADGIKYNTGIISGYTSQTSNVEDAYSRDPSFITSTAFIHKGGPVLNSKGLVVGIGTSKGIIPSRTFLNVYEELCNNLIVKIPNLGLAWNPTTRELLELKSVDPSVYAIYTRKIMGDSCLDKLEEGDIIKKLVYMDPYVKNPDIVNIFARPKDLFSDSTEIACYFDRLGDAEIGIDMDQGFSPIVDRKFSLAEIADIIPVGSPLQIFIYRENLYLLETKYANVPTFRIPNRYPLWEPYIYEIFGGIVCANIDKQHELQRDEFEKQLIIVQVFPDTTVSKSMTLKKGMIIKEVNGISINSVEKLKPLLSSCPKIITIKTTDLSFFIITLEQAIKDDTLSMQRFSIRHEYLLKDA